MMLFQLANSTITDVKRKSSLVQREDFKSRTFYRAVSQMLNYRNYITFSEFPLALIHNILGSRLQGTFCKCKSKRTPLAFLASEDNGTPMSNNNLLGHKEA